MRISYTFIYQIITGAQIPLSQLRNDAVDNLLGALTIAGHYADIASYQQGCSVEEQDDVQEFACNHTGERKVRQCTHDHRREVKTAYFEGTQLDKKFGEIVSFHRVHRLEVMAEPEKACN